MSEPRRTPYDVVFGGLAAERFPDVRESLAAGGTDPYDLDAFALDRAVVTLLREMVPDEGVGQAVAQYLTLLHHAYLYWLEGKPTLRLSRDQATALLEATPASGTAATGPRVCYIQFPERMVWAQLAEDSPSEPLDGFFLHRWPAGGLFVLAIFGLHANRPGLSLAEAEGHPEPDLIRADGSPLFASVLPGGARAGLYSILSEEELLELANRALTMTGAAADHG